MAVSFQCMTKFTTKKKKKKNLKGNWEKGKISVNHILSKDLVPMLLKKKKQKQKTSFNQTIQWEITQMKK